MKIISLGIWGLFFSFSSYFFIGPKHSYSVLLPEGTELVQIDTLDGGIKNHTFIAIDNKNNFEYSISFSVVGGEKFNLLEPETISKYKEDCNCEIKKTEKVEYPNFNGVRYFIVKEIDNVKLGGEVYISEVKNGRSINVVSMVLYDQRELITSNLDVILNTLVLNF